MLAADNSGFTGATTLGSYTANDGTSDASTAVPAQVFNFTATSAAFVRMTITSNYGAAGSGFGEAAFDAQFTAIPEPSSFALVGLVAAGFVVYRRRKAMQAVS